ncbi:hypothetical protein ACLOJK_037274 [Asimina triloba]
MLCCYLLLHDVARSLAHRGRMVQWDGCDRPWVLIWWATDSGGHDLLPLTGLRRMAVTHCPDELKETSCYDLDFCLDAVDSL